MPKAAACVVGCQVGSTGKVDLSVMVSSDTGVTYGTTITVDFAVSAALFLVTLRTALVASLAGQGVNLVANDVVIFGGPG